MAISGIGATGYLLGYETRRTQKNISDYNFAGQMNNTASVQNSNEPITLHWSDTKDGDAPIGACGLADGGSATVYKPADFDPANPVYKVKIWDEVGNMTERMVDISKVAPENCDEIDMFAYSSHLTVSGECPNAQSAFMSADGYYRSSNSGADFFGKTNWVNVIKDIMQIQYHAGNLKGYLDYKQFWDFMEQ